MAMRCSIQKVAEAVSAVGTVTLWRSCKSETRRQINHLVASILIEAGGDIGKVRKVDQYATSEDQMRLERGSDDNNQHFVLLLLKAQQSAAWNTFSEERSLCAKPG